MLAAVKEVACSRPDEEREHMQTYLYLKACNLLFEEGILSKTPITSSTSPLLKNMEDGFKFFSDWRQEVANTKGGLSMI